MATWLGACSVSWSQPLVASTQTVPGAAAPAAWDSTRASPLLDTATNTTVAAGSASAHSLAGRQLM